MKLLVLLTAFVPAISFAQYATIAETPENGQPSVGACGTPLPLNQSRNVSGARLVCGGAKINLPMRTAFRSDKWDEWSLTERSGGGSLESRREMQALRLQEDPISYSGQAKYKTYETWTYTVRMKGANPNKCHTWQQSYPCQKSRQEPIRKWVCHPRPVPPPAVYHDDYGRGGGGGNYDGGVTPKPAPKPVDRWDGGGSYKKLDGPSTGKMDSGRTRTFEEYQRSGTSRSGTFPGSGSGSERKSGGPPRSPDRTSPSSGSSRGNSKSGSNRRSALDRVFDVAQELFISRAVASEDEDCGYETSGYKTVYEDAVCTRMVTDVCEWEESHLGQRECSTETLNYKVEFAKPNTYDANWQPGQKSYYDLLPNKYDLLPGEWEKYTLTINEGQQDEIFGMGLSSTIRPKLNFENQWNEYQVRFNQEQFACSKGSNLEVKAEILTQKRIRRKAPNALVPAVDGANRDRSLERAQFFMPGGHVSLLRPVKIHVIDSSNETMMVASRQSRTFKNLDSNAIETEGKEDHPHKQATAQDTGFLKNTLLKVRLIEKGGCWGENDKIFADVLDTTSALTKGAQGNLYVPLDGSYPGVASFYQPLGIVGKVFSFLPGKPLDLQLNPGRVYEFQITMQQQGLPFYENGCLNGALTCEPKDANPAMYGDELQIKFVADDQFDQRSWVQRWENWYSKKLWNKFFTCGEK